VQPGIAEAHEALAESASPQEAFGTATQVEAERDSHAAQNLVENQDNDTRLADTGAAAERSAPGSAQPSGDANAPGPIAGEAQASVGPGTERPSGSEASPEGDRVHQGAKS